MNRKSIILVFIMFLILSFVFLFGKNFLVVNEKPKKSDVIVVLSGGSERLEKAATLYHEGYAEYVILTNSDASGTTKEEAIAFGIPEEAIILEDKATSTYTNALYTKAEMEKLHFNSAIVVTSDYHTRRTKLSFERVFKKTDTELIYVASGGREADDIPTKTAVREYVKFVGYLLGMYQFIDLE